jgi:3-phosphoshikimate 1-carboxyvinyltransferase
VKVLPAAALVGHVQVPGDKSVSHRAVMLGAIAEGETRVRGFGRSADTMSTVDAVRALGVEVDEFEDDELLVHGVGLRGLRPAEVDCGNAGTLMRLVMGILAGQQGAFELRGDESLSRRPMERVAEPLRRMDAHIDTTDGHAPVRIVGSDALRGIEYVLPVASAQVKSAILLAGLNADAATTVIEPAPSRDHTELMLQAGGVRVRRRPRSVTIEAPSALRFEGELLVPGDFSSAAPLIVAAALLPGSELTIHDVGVNPRRTGLLDVLERMGAHVSVFNRRRAGAEPVADIEIRSTPLVATTVQADEVPSLVDELPLVALAAAHARGTTLVTGAEELRVKESDRVEAVADALRSLGARVTVRLDGWEIVGVPARLRGGRMRSVGDHRIAMLGAVAGLTAREPVEIGEPEAVAVSFPRFFELLDSVAKR